MPQQPPDWSRRWLKRADWRQRSDAQRCPTHGRSSKLVRRTVGENLAARATDKTTHNVLGDIGVLSVAHVDLRTGLPWQELFARVPGARPDASRRPQHVQSRHLVIIDADADVDAALLARTLRQIPTITALLAHD